MNKNNIDRVTVNNGGHVADHSRGEDPIVKTPPQKATGDIPAEKIVGLAKASPNFKPVEVVKEKPKTKAEEKQIIAESKEEPEQENDEDETN